MKTILHHYYLNTDDALERDAYWKLRHELEERFGGSFEDKCFNVLADTRKSHNGAQTEEVELDTGFLFNNQWNEAGDGARRLFDWYEAIYRNREIKEGHWLEITPEMAAIRRETLTCGYCGKYVKANEPHKWHCEKCLGSEYLKENQLRLLRLLPVCDKRDRSYATETELREILPLYREAQGLGQAEREKAKASHNRRKVAALIPNAEKKGAELLEAAKVETQALTWVLDHELNLIDNVIYYPHTKRFCFGWRTPLTAEERSKLLDVVSEFPFDYDIK